MTRTVQFHNLAITIEEAPTEVIYRFVGDVDENFRHKDVPKVKRDLITFQLAGIKNFNSVGIREWIYFVRDFANLGQLVFEKCSVTMIDQINMVPDTLGTGRIESFYAPYFCDSADCHREVNLLVDVEQWQHFLNNKVAPQFRCDQCNGELEFDALEESYFLFASQLLPKVG